MPLSQIKATFPVLKNPANRHKAVGFTLEQWHYAFTNTFSEEESRQLYERYHIPASGRIFWGSVLANIHPATTTTRSTTRTPTGRRCCSSPAARTTSCRRRSSSRTPSTTRPTAVTEVKEFDGPHLLPAREGWEEIADYALDWAVRHTT